MNTVDEKNKAFLRQHIERVVVLTDDEFADIFSHFNYSVVAKQKFLIRENESVNHLYFIVSGLVKLVYSDGNAKEHIVSFAMEDWWETDFFAFHTKGQSTFTLQCIEDTFLFCLSRDDFWKLNATSPKWQRFFIEKAIAGHIASQQLILSLITLDAKEKYEQFLHLYPSLQQRISKALLASYLGVSRETLSRLFLTSLHSKK